jgi:hypothetical protein
LAVTRRVQRHRAAHGFFAAQGFIAGFAEQGFFAAHGFAAPIGLNPFCSVPT